GIGPPVKDGFYYDFDVDKPFTPEDLKAIEKKIRRVARVVRAVVPVLPERLRYLPLAREARRAHRLGTAAGRS
ncbi:hypothetical protein, partial [Streptomyces sp. NPDC003090]|uniref:hypothetical protein n=1 Tax=Streptomyces sp. NPDC003090 TaxID=3154274 RepID=UPI00380D095E